VIRVAAAAGRTDLRQLFGCFPSGVTAVCGLVGAEPVGMVASSFTSVSLDPPLVSVCMANTSTTWPRLRTLDRLGLSVLGAEHGAACRQLAAVGGADRFAGIEVDLTEAGAVLIRGAAAWLECALVDEVPAGDHSIVLLRIEDAHYDPGTPPLVFHGSRFRRLLE
jgi:flavin reductase (DIM6/NTAB) family NADH-FMN oxidoreductase RutF